MILADQGADVIKIESPAGDHMRRVGTKHKGMTSSFLTCNRGKRSMCVDVKQSKGLALVLELVKSADVLVQNFRPGVIERMGLGEDRVRELKPDIIYLSSVDSAKTVPTLISVSMIPLFRHYQASLTFSAIKKPVSPGWCARLSVTKQQR